MRTITVYGRRWFKKVNGNTYHSVDVYVDGEFLGREPFTCGYGSQYRLTALEVLVKNGVYEKKPGAVFWREVEEHGDKLVDICADVQRKKEL